MQRKKLKLLPSLKEKKRYLVVLIKARSGEKAKKAVDKALLEFLGILGYAEVGPMVMEMGKKNSDFYCVLSINRSCVDKVKAAFSLVGVRCVGVSGSLKKVRRFL